MLDMECQERNLVYGDDIIYCLKDDEDMQINGSQIQIIDTNLNSDIALGQVIYGHGNNGKEEKSEGARYKNLIFTNALGPVFVKNPWFAEKIIKEAINNENIKEIPEEEFELERKSMECIKEYTEKKLKNK